MTPNVVLYTRKQCGLCDEAEATLRRLARILPFTLTPVDIDTDPALRERYNDSVPVVAVGERVVAQAPIEPAGLERALAHALAEGRP